jgi:hypothetical protein
LGVERRLIGDELFEPVSAAWRTAAGPEKLPLTDYARLLWIRRLHDEGHRRVLWLDADILILEKNFALPVGDFVCRELWAFQTGEQLHARSAVNNCAMAFTASSPLLNWHLDVCATAPSRGPLHRLALGPRLLTERRAITPLPLITTVPTLSPLLINAILHQNSALIAAFRSLWEAQIGAVHLYRSLGHTADGPALVDPRSYDQLIDKLRVPRQINELHLGA